MGKREDEIMLSRIVTRESTDNIQAIKAITNNKLIRDIVHCRGRRFVRCSAHLLLLWGALLPRLPFVTVNVRRVFQCTGKLRANEWLTWTLRRSWSRVRSTPIFGLSHRYLSLSFLLLPSYLVFAASYYWSRTCTERSNQCSDEAWTQHNNKAMLK